MTRFFSSDGPCTSTSSNPYYISTPIYYVNAVPHIGHLYTSIIADILARFQRLRYPQRRVVFNTGTDEHGYKIQRAAEVMGEDPRRFCDRISRRFKDLADAGNVSYTKWTRTTDESHYNAVTHFWRELEKRGHIYKGSHEGWYSISDECFYTESQIESFKDLKTGEQYMVSKESGSKVDWTTETNYKFRLSSFRTHLLEWLSSSPSSILPPSRQASLISLLSSDENALTDLSISRSRERLKWGIEVPGDEGQTIYVWLDALINYLSAIGYPWRDLKEMEESGWPSDVHIIGKDILRFHTIYFPSFLLALSLPLPKTILAHAHWTLERFKMSKSKGNVVDPFEAIETYGVDGVRWYFARVGCGAWVDDSDWSDEQVRKHYKWELQGLLGNLLARITSAKHLSLLAASEEEEKGFVWGEEKVEVEDETLDTMLRSLPRRVEDCFQKFEIGRALDGIVDCLKEANAHYTSLKPWLPTTPARTRQRANFYSFETLRICGILLQAFIPGKAAEMLDFMRVGREERGWDYLEVGLGGRGREGRREGSGGKVLFPKLVESSS